MYFTALIVAIMVPVALLVEKRMGDIISRQAEQRGFTIARNLAAVSQGALVSYNYVALTQSAERAQRDEEGIAEVIILDKEGRVAGYSGHVERQGTVLADRVSTEAVASRVERAVAVEMPREDGSGAVERGLDIAAPVFIGGSNEKWGTVRVRLSTEGIHRRIRNTRLALVAVGLLATVVGALGSFVMARHITEPLSTLVAGTIRAAGGDLETRIQIETGDEIEELARTFNDMVGRIQADQQAIGELNRILEEKVLLRTQDLSRANDALMKAYAGLQKAEAQMILRDKMASLGQVVAGIAHEINTPASAIGAAVVNMTGDLEALTAKVRALASDGVPAPMAEPFYALLDRVLSPDPRRSRASTSEVRQRSRVLEEVLLETGFAEAREMAVTFARLGLHTEVAELLAAARDAGVRPPVEILGAAGSLALAVSDIRLSIDAITRMVKALRTYSHPDQAEMVEADVHEGLETTLTILRNQVKYGIVVERRYSRLPRVVCNTNELNQVWTNLIHNAIQAMNGMGRITIETYRKEDAVGVRITDTGPGIPDEMLGRIFDPFFTTKDQGEGTGLGLGIAHQIVERHRGRIGVESEPGRTSFEVLLPIQATPAEAAP